MPHLVDLSAVQDMSEYSSIFFVFSTPHAIKFPSPAIFCLAKWLKGIDTSADSQLVNLLPGLVTSYLCTLTEHVFLILSPNLEKEKTANTKQSISNN